MMEIPVGAKGRVDGVVTDQLTAAAIGSGSVEVFATPYMVAAMENAACEALRPYYGEGENSVGTKLEISHDAATPVGMKYWAEAEVTEVDRRRIVLKVTAYDETGVIGSGTHERFIIQMEKFLAKAEAKKELVK
ncbi:MAG: thioesterase family protein [Oscillospiraceae bacterium]|nr:thioesterase family protein [Oscillospiraceae bacterium]MDD6502059.1 thioesterase family protein [Oscillospiraceae bacterium]MDY4104894.1 thioesterase family protein [Oscillospiraceae bacterium]